MSNGILGVSQLEMLSQSGTGTITVIPPATNTNRTLTLPDETGTVITTASLNPLTSGTAVASTSGTSIDFTGIPSWVKRITVMFNGVSTNGSSKLQVQIGISTGVEVTGYLSTCFDSSFASSTEGFLVSASIASGNTRSGSCTICAIGSNTWVEAGVVGRTDSASGGYNSGNKTLGGTLDRVRITTVNGTDTYDAGSINIMYE